MNPTYLKRGDSEIDGNPLSAHLPLAPETNREAFLALALRPEYSPEERSLPGAIRRVRIQKLERFFVPVLPAHISALNSICTSVISGYIARNPMSATGQKILQGSHVELNWKPSISMITGCSGMGKSTLISRILSHLGGQVWQHESFRGTPFPETQIVWLRRNLPEHCTVGNLCSTFGNYTDEVLKLKMYSGIFAKLSRGSRGQYVNEIRKIITANHVGLLVLDEFQNISLMWRCAEDYCIAGKLKGGTWVTHCASWNI